MDYFSTSLYSIYKRYLKRHQIQQYKIFVDDTEIQKSIKGDENRSQIHSDLLAVSQRAKRNSIKLNEEEFELKHFEKEKYSETSIYSTLR